MDEYHSLLIFMTTTSNYSGSFSKCALVLSSAILFLSSLGFADVQSSRADRLIDSIIATQKKISSIHCKYHHKRYVNAGGPAEFQGDIDYLAPQKILMHFLYPANEYVLVDDSTLLIYGVENTYGMRYSKKCFSETEKQIAEQIGQIKMNLLESMRSAYSFSLTDTSASETFIISATPHTGWKSLSKIIISINPVKNYLRSVEIYSKDGTLFSSTSYSNFVIAGSTGAYFPHAMKVRLMVQGIEQKDEITYSRIEFNKGFKEKHFIVPVAKNANIVDNLNDCK